MANIQPFDFSVDLIKAIIWQYNKSTNIQELIQAKQDWYDVNQTEFWTDWVVDVFDLRTCNDFGCIVWAIILGIPLTFITPATPHTGIPWGFDATNHSNFDGNYNFSSNSSGTNVLSTAQKRIVLQLRYRQMIARGTIPEINRILKDVLGSVATLYMVDNLDMTMTLTCVGPIPFFISFILTEFDLIPRPAGVSLSVVSV